MSSKSETFLIVGGGLAGAKAAEALRDNDFDGDVVVFATEQHLPYERPPLSKEYLAGKKTLDEFTALPAAWYRDHNVDLRLGTPVSSVYSHGHLVGLPDQSTLHYDKLLLATGSAPRRPAIPGADADRVHYLRTVDDADALNAVLTEGSSLAIVGGGWIGLEVAAGARGRDVNVTVVEAAELPLLGALGREAAEVFAKLHREHGVDLRLRATVEEITTADGAATGLRLGDGSTVDADAVLVAVGAAPNTDLALRAGLTTGPTAACSSTRRCAPVIPTSSRSAISRRLSIHSSGRGSAPSIGPTRSSSPRSPPQACSASQPNTPSCRTSSPTSTTSAWSTSATLPSYDRVVFRGDVDGREFVAFWLDGENRVLAGMNVNIWDVLDDVKSLIRSRSPVDPDKLSDPKQALGSII